MRSEKSPNLIIYDKEKLAPETIEWAEDFAKKTPYCSCYLRYDEKVKGRLEFGGLVCSINSNDDLTPEQLNWCKEQKKSSIQSQKENIAKIQRGIYDSGVVASFGGFRQYLAREKEFLAKTEQKYEFEWMIFYPSQLTIAN